MTTSTKAPGRGSPAPAIGARRGGAARSSPFVGSSGRLTRLFVSDYVRNPANLVLLIVVPAVFVLFSADALAEAAELLGGQTAVPVQSATVVWAATFLSGVAMFFQVAGSRAADRRLVGAGTSASALTVARMVAGLAVAVVVSVVAFMTLTLRADVDAPARLLAGTLLASVVYVGIGAAVATCVPEVTGGSIVLLFVWILDVFFGPVLGTGTQAVWRVLPTHFATLWAVDVPSGHAGRPGDLGFALAAAAVASAVAALTVAGTVRRTRRSTRRQPARHGMAGEHLKVTRRERPSASRQLRVGVVLGLRSLLRTPSWWILLVVVPAVFVLLAEATTPHSRMPVTIVENGFQQIRVYDLADIHGGTMAPVAVASLAMLAGLFQALQTQSADRRLRLTGYRRLTLAGTRVATAAAAALAAVMAAMVTTVVVFDAGNWVTYVAGNVLLAMVYVLLGAATAPVLGRLGGVFFAFLIPFVDIGLGQSPMLNGSPPAWARAMPGYGPTQMLLDGALTSGIDRVGAGLVGLAWLAGLLALVSVPPLRRH